MSDEHDFDSPQEEVEKVSLAKYLLPVLGFILLLWVSWFCAISWLSSEFKNAGVDISGQLGDSFGTINALFSGLAFGGVIVAIFLQKKELELQRRELKKTNIQTKILAEESKLQREEFEKQNQALEIQRFESTFFRMLQSLQDIIDNLKIALPSMDSPEPESPEYEFRVYKGREAFEAMVNHIEYGNFLPGKNYEEGPSAVDRSFISEACYGDCFRFCDNEVGHYFRLLYHIIKFIDESDAIDDTNKKTYIHILRAHFSINESKCILYNSLSDGLGYSKLYVLIDKYDLMQNLPARKLHFSDHHKYFPSMIESERLRREEVAIENFPMLYSELLARRYPGTHGFD